MLTIEEFLLAFGDDRAAVEASLVERLKTTHEFWGRNRRPLTAAKSILAAAIRDENDAVREMLWIEAQAWWEQQVDPRPMIRLLDAISVDPDRRALRWLALLCAESAAELTDDPRVEWCRFVTRRWLLGEIAGRELGVARDVVEYAAARAPGTAAAWAARAARDALYAAGNSAGNSAGAAAGSAALKAANAVRALAVRGAAAEAAEADYLLLLARATRAMLPPLRDAVHPQSPRVYEASMDAVLAQTIRR
jgi:hypothetical protein